MIELSARTLYGVAAVFELSCRHGSGPCRVAEISEKHDIPRNYLDQILLELKKADLAVSHRGVNGGYTLGKEPANISVWDVIKVLEGGVNLTRAIDVKSDTLRKYWREAQSRLESDFDKNFEELRVEWQKRQGSLNYSI
ncbi:MAG: Rrf2 family transcriptional regulator [bacterium]